MNADCVSDEAVRWLTLATSARTLNLGCRVTMAHNTKTVLSMAYNSQIQRANHKLYIIKLREILREKERIKRKENSRKTLQKVRRRLPLL